MNRTGFPLQPRRHKAWHHDCFKSRIRSRIGLIQALGGTQISWVSEMQTYMLIAGMLLLIIGAVHSAGGEILIFRHLRARGLVPTIAPPPLKERNIRILWATWHIVTVLGWAFGFVLLRLSHPTDEQAIRMLVENTTVVAFFVSSLLVLIGTKGRPPGWLGLLGVAALAWMASAA